MTDQTLVPFASPSRHAAIAHIIRQRSANQAEVRDVALAGLDLRAAHDVLDLGCGFGFMAEVIGSRLAPEARILGVDACEENRAPFLRTVDQSSRRGEFECLRLTRALPWPDQSFDLVLASYSLYYFADVLSEIPRVLRPDGLFLAITHSEVTSRALCRTMGLDEAHCPVTALLRRFSAENAAHLLGPLFAHIERIDYPNALRFEPPQQDDLLEYVRFKLPLLWPETRAPDEIPIELRQRLTDTLNRNGCLVLDKNDTIFRCQGPKVG